MTGERKVNSELVGLAYTSCFTSSKGLWSGRHWHNDGSRVHFGAVFYLMT